MARKLAPELGLELANMPDHVAHGDKNRGILIMLVAVMCIALIDPAAKYAAQRLPVLQVIWGRYAFASALIFSRSLC